ncbi:MAG TPA: replication factor C large subunit [Candidatus Nanoarchaeia archaeon]|nr:replication factor C large subunit [Candidatus Nanoarchaeia archaeon]
MIQTNGISLVEKYRAHVYKDIHFQAQAIEDIKKFLHEFPKKRGAILHGPAGTGKTSLALAAAYENNIEVLELNASDLRNRAKLEEVLKPATLQQSLFKRSKVLLMDEVDGVTGTDIGGISELIRILEETKHPIIMTCNDIWQSKLAQLRGKCKLIEMKSLSPAMITEIIRRVAEKEGITRDSSFFSKIAIKSQGDLRAALNDLQSYAQNNSLAVDTTERRDVEDTIFNILRRLFKERQDFLNLFDSTKLSLDEILLWLEENIPREYKNESLAKAYYALGNADVFRGRIYKNQSWRFLVYQNIFQSAGVSYAKNEPNASFTKYEPPKRILKIWMNNQKIVQKKSIAKKYARLVHCSTKRALSDFFLLKPILQKPEVQHQLRLSEEEIDFLKK